VIILKINVLFIFKNKQIYWRQVPGELQLHLMLLSLLLLLLLLLCLFAKKSRRIEAGLRCSYLCRSSFHNMNCKIIMRLTLIYTSYYYVLFYTAAHRKNSRDLPLSQLRNF